MLTMYKLIIISGSGAFIFLILTMLAGVLFFKFHVKWINMKWHIRLAALTLVFAVIHVLAIVYSNLM